MSPERAQSAEEFCSTLFSKVWEGANAEGYSLPHELLAGGEAFGMCYILVLLRKLHNPEKPTTTIEEMFDLISLDGYPLRDHLNILRKTSVSSDQRMSRAKMLAPLMRMLFISLKDGPGQRVGGVSFSSYEPDTKVVTFQYTVEETSPRNGSPSTNLVYAGNLVFGVGRDGQPTPHRFVTFNVEGNAIRNLRYVASPCFCNALVCYFLDLSILPLCSAPHADGVVQICTGFETSRLC